jgi:hypothetical protein
MGLLYKNHWMSVFSIFIEDNFWFFLSSRLTYHFSVSSILFLKIFSTVSRLKLSFTRPIYISYIPVILKLKVHFLATQKLWVPIF